MNLGNFSVSLSVKNLSASREFYEKLGFHSVGGDGTHYVIMQNETSTIGLFHGMFEKNALTFNPGWDRNSNPLPELQDVRDIQRQLKSRGLTPVSAADESTTGPASLMLLDPGWQPNPHRSTRTQAGEMSLSSDAPKSIAFAQGLSLAARVR